MTDPLDQTVQSNTNADEAYCSACNQSFGVQHEVCPNDGARLVKLKATRDVLLGRVFDGRYELRASLGQGGMGTVYRALQISVDREVAIKVIHPKLASDRVAVKRFLREARLASRLSQPNIVNVYDFGQTDDGILYLVMELLRGHTLARELDAKHTLAVRRVATIGLQLTDALEVAHAQGIVHRDLKPSNIVVLDDPPGRDLVKVLDFGLAKSLVSDTTSLTTNSDAMLGTPLYMPPEQIEGRPSDQRADLYAFGCILHHMLRGMPPFVRDQVNAVLSAHVNDRPPPLPPGVPKKLAAMIEKLMAKSPSDRPASAADLRAVFQSALETGSQDVFDTAPTLSPPAALERSSTDPIAFAMTDPGAARAAPKPRPRKHWIPIAAIAGVCAVGGGVAYLLSGPRGSPAGVDAAAAATAPVPAPQAPVPVAVDAQPRMPLEVDAATIDAAGDTPLPPPAHADAGVRQRPRPRDAGVIAPLAPADAPAAPPADASAPHAAPADAQMPALDFYPPRGR